MSGGAREGKYSDAERLDWLEQDVEEGPLCIHNLPTGAKVPCRGLGLKPTGRTLRQALDQVMSATGVTPASLVSETATFQQRVREFVVACFGEKIADDVTERNHRFLEESLELVQATGCTASEAHQLVDYVYGRPVGESRQECGGVMVTLAALCSAAGLDMAKCGEYELARVWGKMDVIRAKQAAKPKHSPLPEALDRSPQAAE